MNIGQMFPGEYLKASDLGEKRYALTIKSVRLEEFANGEQKPVMRFLNTEKAMVLNKTNAGSISRMLGDETDAWVGQKVTLYADVVDFQGRRVPAIRVHEPVQQPTRPLPPLPEPPPPAPEPPPPAPSHSSITAEFGAQPIPQAGQVVDDDDVPF